MTGYDFGTMTLGALIDALAKRDEEQRVVFDFCGFQPSLIVASYRGYYDHLALGYAPGDMRGVSVGDLLAKLHDAVGRTFSGWKGGLYMMDRGTPVWVDNPGEATGTQLVAVELDPAALVLATRHEP